MKRLLMSIVLLGMASTVWAQASSMTQQATAASESKFYVSGVGGVTFGNTTGGTYGGEFGIKLSDAFEVFGEGGRMTDVTTSGAEGAAATIGGYLGTLGKGTPTWDVVTPVNYGAVGLRYVFPPTGRFEPYIAVSLGGANVENKATFALDGTDVTGSLPTYGVSLGSDLSGQTNNFLFTAGGGVRMLFGGVMADMAIRYGRIFSDPGIDTFRLYFGAGYRF
jgi:hypothetical protein